MDVHGSCAVFTGIIESTCGHSWTPRGPPKAEVTSSNLVGRASSVVESKWPELARKLPPKELH